MQARIPLAVMIGALVASPMAIGAVGTVTRVSVTAFGAQMIVLPYANANGPAISADASRVLFTSAAPFSGASTGNVRQLFSRNLATDRVSLVSSSALGTPATSDVDESRYATSLDGRYAVFTATASSLVPSDTNARERDVFRKDLSTGAVVVVSRDVSGTQPSLGVTGDPSISADGSRVAFTSGAQPLVAADTNGVADIYVADLRARTIVLASRDASGAQSAQAAGRASISADGRVVAYEMTNTSSQSDIAIAHIATRAITPLAAPGATLPSLSGNGSRVAYLKDGDVWVRDIGTSVPTRVSDAGASGPPVIAFDGSRVAYTDTGVTPTVKVFTVAGGARTAASTAPNGGALGSAATRAALAGNGSLAAFAFDDSAAGGVVPVTGDTNGALDVFATQLAGGDTTPPVLTARVAAQGSQVVVSGQSTDASGVIEVLVAGRHASVKDDGTFAMTLTQRVGPASVVVSTRDAVGLAASTSLATNRAWAAAGAATSPVRPRSLRVRVVGRTATVRFVTGVGGVCRVEIRRRITGTAHASSFRLLSARQSRCAPGTRVVRMKVATAMRTGVVYQVRVLVSSARGLGTAATTIIMP